MKPKGIDFQKRWALVRGPKALPVVYASRRDALDDCCGDEYPVLVWVSPAGKRHASASVLREWEES